METSVGVGASGSKWGSLSATSVALTDLQTSLPRTTAPSERKSARGPCGPRLGRCGGPRQRMEVRSTVRVEVGPDLCAERTERKESACTTHRELKRTRFIAIKHAQRAFCIGIFRYPFTWPHIRVIKAVTQLSFSGF